MNAIDNIKNNIDWQIVTSTVVASVVVGALYFGLKQAGLGSVANVVKGG